MQPPGARQVSQHSNCLVCSVSAGRSSSSRYWFVCSLLVTCQFFYHGPVVNHIARSKMERIPRAKGLCPNTR